MTLMLALIFRLLEILNNLKKLYASLKEYSRLNYTLVELNKSITPQQQRKRMYTFPDIQDIAKKFLVQIVSLLNTEAQKVYQ